MLEQIAAVDQSFLDMALHPLQNNYQGMKLFVALVIVLLIVAWFLDNFAVMKELGKVTTP